MYTDPRFVRFLEVRQFHPVDRLLPNHTVNVFRGHIYDSQGVGHAVSLRCRYTWKNDNTASLPKAIYVLVDNMPSRATVKILGTYKLIVSLDQAVQAAIVLAKLCARLKDDPTPYKDMAQTMLNGDFFLNGNNNNNPGRAPEAQPNPENPRP